MAFEVKDGVYVHRVFYIELPVALGGPGNYMGFLYRPEGDPETTPWHYKYRFRYYKDNDLTRASKDERSWYEVTFKAGSTPEYMVRMARKPFDLAGVKLDEIVVESDSAEGVMQVIGSQPWCHRSTEDAQGRTAGVC